MVAGHRVRDARYTIAPIPPERAPGTDIALAAGVPVSIPVPRPPGRLGSGFVAPTGWPRRRPRRHNRVPLRRSTRRGCSGGVWRRRPHDGHRVTFVRIGLYCSPSAAGWHPRLRPGLALRPLEESHEHLLARPSDRRGIRLVHRHHPRLRAGPGRRRQLEHRLRGTSPGPSSWPGAAILIKRNASAAESAWIERAGAMLSIGTNALTLALLGRISAGHSSPQPALHLGLGARDRNRPAPVGGAVLFIRPSSSSSDLVAQLAARPHGERQAAPGPKSGPDGGARP